MGFLAKILESIKKSGVLNVRADTGGGSSLTSPLYGAPGDDSNPLPGDTVVILRTAGNGSTVCVGAVDTENDTKADPGERRIYSRTAQGTTAAVIYLKNNGDIDMNGLIIGADGSITLPPLASIRVGPLQVDLVTHTHATPSGPSGPPIPGA